MTARLAHIIRHPIKSVGFEEIGNASLQQGRVLPFDRIWAVSHAAAKFDGPLADWARKMNFLRGAAAPDLMAVRLESHADGRLSLHHPRLAPLTVDLASAAGQADLIAWLAPLWPDTRPPLRALERVPGQALTDMAEPYLSLLSLTSLADLGATAEGPLSIHRFRGNLWVAGWQPWAERALIGKRLRIGSTLLEVAMPITRCRATCASPVTGTEDFDTLDALTRRNGDTQFGLYATVVTGGAIATGDTVEILS